MLGILTAMVLFVVPIGICSVCILCAIAGAVVIPATLNVIEFVSLIVPSLCIALRYYFLSIWNASDQASRTFLNKYRHLVTTAQEEAKLATHSATQANHSPASAAPEQASADQRETDLQSQPLSMTQECAKSLNSANEEDQQDVKVRKKEHERMRRRIDMLESDNRVAASEIQGYIEAHQLQTKEAEDALE
ncbi:hypothetical protein C7974DRAFT_380826 [Boeremia exigua]|uniref:uncharacterized protein n=1 Tax=Boeremia exigua TaxID=749465 RepID=UPI001E8E2CA5|nr:uncharacterized protein C7974DRAFT_380826 [Boeremia exigua]KAH6613114.1 hypothetical protein C7974DRAFT_380826 [Boeremia exigua]